MANSRFYSSVALQTTLTNGVNPADTVIPVQATTGFPGAPFTLALDYGSISEELVEVTSVSALNLTVTRAIDGTSASAHSTGAVVRHVSSARDFTDSRTHEASSSGVHGTTGAVVGTTNTQTLTNKTLTSPAINGATLSGTFSGSISGTLGGSPTFTGQPVFTDTVSVNGTVPGNEQLVVKGAASQSVNLQSWKNSGGTTLASVGSAGALTSTGLTSSGTVSGANLTTTGTVTTVNLTSTGTATTNDLTVTDVATVNTLNVTTLTPGSVNISGGSLLAAASGWTVAVVSAAVLKAGMLTANMAFNRTGAAITVNASGILSTGAIALGTINATYAPDADLGSPLYIHAGHTTGSGTAQISSGVVSLETFQASTTISTGNTISMMATWPIT